MELLGRLVFVLAIASTSVRVIIADGEVNNKESVPVLMWSPERSMSEHHEQNFDQTLGAEEFHESYLRPLSKSSPAATVVFLQDKLHGDDFTHFADVYSIDGEGGAFANIKSLMEENFSLEVPQVMSPGDSIQKLQDGYQGQVHSVASLEELEKLSVEPSSFLLIVHLPATADRLDREQALRENDALIGAVCKHLSKRSISYSSIFTGKAAASGQTADEAGHSSRRLLAEAPEVNSNGTFMNISDGQSFLFMRDIYICVKNDKPGCVANFTLVPTPDTAKSSVVMNTTATIELVFDNESSTAGNNNISIVITALNQGDRWIVTRTALFITPEDSTKNETDIQNGTLSQGADIDFKVPILYSFHCTQMRMDLVTLNNDLAGFKGTYVVFNGFQFQPFNVQNNQFFNSVDCVGFFTSAIWMGLFPAILLLGILAYGTLMLLDLSIMDRYDDPKGKTISVHASSD